MASDPKVTKALIEFAIRRAGAINAYADYERSLALLFNTLMGNHGNPIGVQKSFLVFSQLLVYRHRRKTLTDLVDMAYPGQFDVFLKSLLDKLAKLDGDRNKVVHWIVLVSTTGGRAFDPEKDVALHEHPNLFGRKKFSKADLIDFEEKAEFYRLLVFYFDMFLKYPGLPGDPSKTTWLEIFQQRVEYPPPTHHPLFQMNKAPSAQLLSSLG